MSSSGPSAGPLGGVTVTVAGPDFTRTTTSLTTDPIGSWQVTDVPLPGTYTVTFSAAGYGTQALGVDLSSAAPESPPLSATLAPATSNVTGRVVEATNGVGIVGATVTLTGQGIDAHVAHGQPAGRRVRLRQPAPGRLHDHLPAHRFGRPDAGDHVAAR